MYIRSNLKIDVFIEILDMVFRIIIVDKNFRFMKYGFNILLGFFRILRCFLFYCCIVIGVYFFF